MCLIAITDSPRIPSVRSRQWRQQIIANSQSETLARFPIFQDSRRQTWASQPGTRPGKTGGVRAGARGGISAVRFFSWGFWKPGGAACSDATDAAAFRPSGRLVVGRLGPV